MNGAKSRHDGWEILSLDRKKEFLTDSSRSLDISSELGTSDIFSRELNPNPGNCYPSK